MAIKTALGLMSGTSMDGIDVAAIRSDGEGLVERGPSLFVPYEADFRQRIEAGLEAAKAITEREERPGELAALERDLTLRHAEAVQRFQMRHSDWAQADIVGFHGQTVLHRPADALTVQLGDGQLLAAEIGMPVVFDMRAADMAAGGQGAPLVPAYHAALAGSLPAPYRDMMPMVFVNIGGISNVTYVPDGGDPVAFDSGPGNQLIDQWMQREGGMPFDQDGAVASEGGVDRAVMQRYLAEPFFARKAPKSLDRGDFTLANAEGMELADGARTLAAVAAEAIHKAREQMPRAPKLWIICGGGRRNPHIVADLKAAAGEGAKVALAEEAGLDGDATEAEAWAYLAIRSARGLPLTWPTTTGCKAPTPGGVLARPAHKA